MAKHLSNVLLVLVIHAGMLTIAEDVKDSTYYKVYYDVTSFQGCFRRFNGTHQIGCSTNLRGNVGVLHYIEDSTSLKWLLDSGPHYPYIAVLKLAMFTTPTLEKLLKSNKINGLILIATSYGSEVREYPLEFSPDHSCPNPTSDISSCAADYNPAGAGIMFRDIGMPWMVMLNDTEIQELLSAVSRNAPNADGTPPSYPLAAAELKAFMQGAGSTPICRRRSNMQTNLSPDTFCDFLGGRSSIAMLGVTPRNETRDLDSVVMVTAWSDSFSLFQNLASGAHSPLSSVVVLLATVEALKPYSDIMHSAGKDVLFSLLTGESFDYIGSQKLVYDMKAGVFPNLTSKIGLSNVDMVIELSDLLTAAQTKELFSHLDPTAAATHSQVQDFLRNLTSTAASENLVLSAANSTTLPPSSSQMFVREDKSKGFPVVVLSEYNTRFENNHYHSLFDNRYSAETSNFTEYNVTDTADTLTDISTALASAILRYVTKNDSAVVQASNETTQALLYCLHVDPKCDLFYEVISPEHVSTLDQLPGPLPSYVGVYVWYSMDSLQTILLQLMAYYSGTEVESAVKANCTDTPNANAYWMNGKLNDTSREHRCVMASAQFINSTSPAQLIEGYDMTSGVYSTWTESVWPSDDPFHIKLFYLPSQRVTLATSLSGVAMLILSAVLVYFLNRHSEYLFPTLNLTAGVDYSTDL